MSVPLEVDGLEITVDLVTGLIAAQFPQWRHLPVHPVDVGGWDNRTFRLGDELTVRLPSAQRYTAAVDKEHRWLPVLAPELPLPVPVPVALGQPNADYPYPWSVRRRLPGQPATRERISNLNAFAVALADFLRALGRVDPTSGPEPGAHNFFRGGPLDTYAEETYRAIDRLGDAIPREACLATWEAATTATWRHEPVWFHGDVAVGNLLVGGGGELFAVIDFGTCGVGDPACDTVIAWSLLSGSCRDTFRRRLDVDPATWARGRGWALWKSLITLAGNPNNTDAATARHVITQVLTDHAQPPPGVEPSGA